MAERKWSEAQRRAIEARGCDVLVSAGAGSGKTSVLTERVVRRVTEEGVDITRLLVVTFTEAAAAEMRARIMARLTSRLEQARRSGERDVVRWLLRQTARVEQAQISTLHAFCMQLVRRNFLLLRIEPSFVVPDEEDLAVMRAKVCDDLLEQELSNPAADDLRDAMTLFAQDKPALWRRLVLRLDTFACSQPDPRAWLEDMAAQFASASNQPFPALPWTPAFLAWVRNQLAEAQAHAEAGLALAARADELQSYAHWLTGMVERLVEARTAFADPERFEVGLAALAAIDTLGTPRASRSAMGLDAVKACRDAARRAVRRVTEVAARGSAALKADLERLARPVLALCRFTIRFQEQCALQKRRRGWVDFQDLEHFALRVLRDPASGEARRLQEEFVEVCVDEYQDTSPVQEALLEAIRRPEGNLFEVGDVKQSIYRFRMAEPRLFLDKYLGGMERRGGTVIDLRENYRSRPEVVDAVNHVFSTLFCEAMGGLRYDERARMQAAADYPAPPAPLTTEDTLAGPVEVHLVERVTQRMSDGGNDSTDDRDGAAWPDGGDAAGAEENTGSADATEAEELDALEKEAAVIAERIRELMGLVPGTRRAYVWDPDEGAYRPLRYRDIVVLLRSVRSQMNRVLEVLRRFDIPAYGATATGFYTAVEVRWLTAALAAIDNPRRDVELAALLRSPMLRFSDEDLARIRLCADGSLFDALCAAARATATLHPDADSAGVGEALRERCRRTLRQLEAWRTLARRAGAEQVLARVMEDTGLTEYVQAMPGGPLRVANLELLLERARAFDRSSPDGVFGFVTRLRENLWHGLDAGEARLLGENEDVVRVMTIHQSKGLEFPVVFVADLGKRFYRDPDERAFPVHRSLGFGPQAVDAENFQRWPTLCSIAVEAAERAEFLAEEARILYVAMTRARERLILVGSTRDLPRLVREWTRRWSDDPDAWTALVGLPAASWLHWLVPLWARHPDGACLRALGQGDSSMGSGVDARPVAAAARYRIALWNIEGGRALPRPAAAATVSHPVLADPERWLADLRGVASVAGEESGPVQRNDAAANVSEATEIRWFVPPPPGGAPSKVSATDLRRLWAARTRTGAGLRHPAAAVRLLADPQWQAGGLAARDRGNAFHRAMYRLDLQRIDGSLDSVRAELARLCAEGWLTEEEWRAVDAEAVCDLLASPPGLRLRRADRVWREQPFLLRVDVIGGDGRPTPVVVQGVIDCLAQDADGWLILDYKTDAVTASEVDERAKEYTAQVATYRQAVRRALGADRIDAFLYFSSARRWVPVDDIDISQVFQTP